MKADPIGFGRSLPARHDDSDALLLCCFETVDLYPHDVMHYPTSLAGLSTGKSVHYGRPETVQSEVPRLDS